MCVYNYVFKKTGVYSPFYYLLKHYTGYVLHKNTP